MTNLKRVIGFKTSSWTSPDNGNTYPVRRLYVDYPAAETKGLACSVVKCRGDKVFDGVEVGDYVELLYDQYGNCCAVQPVVAEQQDLIDFGVDIASE